MLKNYCGFTENIKFYVQVNHLLEDFGAKTKAPTLLYATTLIEIPHHPS